MKRRCEKCSSYRAKPYERCQFNGLRVKKEDNGRACWTRKVKKPSAAAQAMASQAAQSTIIRNAVPQWFRIDPDQVPTAPAVSCGKSATRNKSSAI